MKNKNILNVMFRTLGYILCMVVCMRALVGREERTKDKTVMA